MQENLTLFRKTMKGENDKKWYTYFAMNDNKQSIKVNLTDDAKTEILKSGIDFPLSIVIDDDNYFITTDKYINNDGISQKVAVCVITSFIKIEKANLEKQTLSSYFNETKELPL